MGISQVYVIYSNDAKYSLVPLGTVVLQFCSNAIIYSLKVRKFILGSSVCTWDFFFFTNRSEFILKD